MRLLVLGANGQLGSDCVEDWRRAGEDVIPATRQDAAVDDAAAIARLVLRVRPGAVINTTAWTNLPGCEDDPARAFAVNAIGALNAARAAQSAGARFLQVSTDYVFDGAATTPYLESAPRRALSVYGASKLAGEDLATQACPGATVVRLSAIYGRAGASGKGGNFVETMLRLAAGGGPVRVVVDQVTSPTCTADIAPALLDVLRAGIEGPVHLAAAGQCSWHEFACAIFELAGFASRPEPTTAAAYGGPVTRPAFSALASERVPPLPHWRDGLARYLARRGAASEAPA